MRLEDYKPKKTNGYGWINVPEDYTFIYELKSYRDISRDKIELFDSMIKYINYYFYNSDLNYNLGDKVAYIQSKLNNGNHCLVEFPIIESYRSHANECQPDDVNELSREEFYRRKNRYRNVGEQFYTIIHLNSIRGNIIITKDGHIYAKDDVINNIINTKINRIADELHKTFIVDKRLFEIHEKDSLIHINNRLNARGKGGCAPRYSGKYTMDELMSIYDSNAVKENSNEGWFKRLVKRLK